MFLAPAFVLLALAAEPAQTYAWPLDLPRVITSSFCEYRSGRFHAGIDLRTGGIGKEVHAPADGCVSRVRCSPTGYGKAVYLKLKDGNTVVFAHLDDFAPELRDHVRNAQHAARRYTVDLYPEPNAFAVEPGEVIAFSGQTGIGVPHLHYEIRDPHERPLNPRLLGVTWPDTTRPVVRRLLVVPADPASSVNGDIVPLVCDVSRTSDGQYTCPPIRAAGKIGFGLDVIDPANNGANILGIHALRTIAEGREVFRIQNDRISYANIRNGSVSFHPFLLDKGRFLLQWRWPGNVCDIFCHTESGGWYTVPGSCVEVLLEATDFFGNKATVTVPLKPDAQEPLPGPVQGGTGRGTVDLECFGAWLVLTAEFTAPEPEAPVIEIDGLRSIDGGAFRRIDDRTFRVGVSPVSGAREFALQVIHERIEPYIERVHVFQRGDGDHTAPIGNVSVTVKSESPYGTLFLRACPASSAPRAAIPMRGTPFHIWPRAAPLDAPVEIAFPIPEDARDLERVHVYRDTGSGWSRQSTRRTDAHLVIAARNLGTFATLEDDIPPAISDILPNEGAALPSKRPAVRATVSDIGSGIADITVTCDGQWLLMEYDPERDLIEWEQDEDLPGGPKEFVFTITDAAGNTTTATRKTAS